MIYQLGFALLGWGYHCARMETDGSVSANVGINAGFKEDAVIMETARCAMAQQYPADAFEVRVVIANRFAAETVDGLRRLPVRVEEVAFEKSTKSRSLNVCLQRLSPDAYEVLVILDADNLMAADFLKVG
ncbi:MAG: hypothetical protein R2795_03975 [Saprospiraceae bacterium]